MADTDSLIGRVFDEKYRVEEQLGAGGMGAVYRATHLRLEQPVALKVMNAHLLESREARARFRREAQTAVKVQHPNAVNVTDYGESADGHVYLVMDFLEGSSLRQIISAEAPLDPARAVSLMAQVAAAVGAAHDANILHRDLKPSNIFIEQRKDAPPIVRLLDFGVAKLLADDTVKDSSAQHYHTAGGVVVGTPRYMSPEQSEGETLTPASDVYSLGVIMYEMLTGETPFSGNNLSLIIKHNIEAPRPLRNIVSTVPLLLEKVVLHALAKTPYSRPSDANEFRRELLAVAEKLGLENARANLHAVLEQLKDEGLESPSGRFVIDIEKLREHRAAQNNNLSEVVVPPVLSPHPARALPTQELTRRQTVILESTPVIVVPPTPDAAPAPVKPSRRASHGSRKNLVCGLAILMLAGVGFGIATLLRPPLPGNNYEGVRQSVGAPPERRPSVTGETVTETPTANRSSETLRGTPAEPLTAPSPAPRRTAPVLSGPTPPATVPVKSPSPPSSRNTNAAGITPFAAQNSNTSKLTTGRAHLDVPTAPRPPVAPDKPMPTPAEEASEAEQRGAVRRRSVTRPR